MSNLNENTPARRVEDNRQAGPLAWDGVTPAPTAELRAAAPITVDQLEHLNPSRTGLGIMERREGGAYVRVADVRRMDAARAAAGVPTHEQDLLDIVRTLCSTAQRLAELSPAQRANYPSPLSPMSPLFQAASAACVERGYTRWGLEIEGAAYPAPATQPAPVAAGIDSRTQFESKLVKAWSRETYVDSVGDVQYVEDWVQGAWIGWGLGRASLAPVAAEPDSTQEDQLVGAMYALREIAAGAESGAGATARAALRVIASLHAGAAPQVTIPAEVPAAARIAMLEKALKYYADGNHLMLSDSSAWDTVSGEPVNFMCDEAGTATVEDGTVAKLALAGEPLADGEERKVSIFNDDLARNGDQAAPQVPTAAEVRAAALEEAAQVVIKRTSVPRDLLGAPSAAMLAREANGKSIAQEIRALAAAPSVEVKGEQGEMGGEA